MCTQDGVAFMETDSDDTFELCSMMSSRLHVSSNEWDNLLQLHKCVGDALQFGICVEEAVKRAQRANERYLEFVVFDESCPDEKQILSLLKASLHSSCRASATYQKDMLHYSNMAYAKIIRTMESR